ncbi:peptidoglycan editing factor PgeF [soil metagenome]
MFAFQDTRGPVEVAFTDRHGGISGGPYASLNLAARTQDDEAKVEDNLARVTGAFTGAGEGASPRVVSMRQVHGATVAVVKQAPVEAPTADALLTTVPGLVLMVRAADCVPVLLADVAGQTVAAAHAGRPGLVAGVVPAVVASLRAHGARELVAWVGPHVCGACYEVPEEMRAEVSGVVPETFGETSWGTPALDIGAGVVAQLRAAGAEVLRVDRCTREDENLFSYRRQGPASGRLAGLVWVRP